MGQAATRKQQRAKARKVLAEVMARPDQVIVIHYSSESFYDIKDGASPRITSIAVGNLETAQNRSFSIHQMAERNGYLRDADKLERHYGELEKLMLDNFYEYVADHRNHSWLHWNMRDISYGFQAIAHRYMVLGGNPVEIPEDKLIDLARVLKGMYGPNYVPHKRLTQLVQLNDLGNEDFLEGKQEADAFDNKEYVKLHQSTLRKVAILAQIVEYASTGSLKTKAKWRDIHGGWVQGFADSITENRFGIIAAFLATLLGAVVSVIPPVHDLLVHALHLK